MFVIYCIMTAGHTLHCFALVIEAMTSCFVQKCPLASHASPSHCYSNETNCPPCASNELTTQRLSVNYVVKAHHAVRYIHKKVIVAVTI